MEFTLLSRYLAVRIWKSRTRYLAVAGPRVKKCFILLIILGRIDDSSAAFDPVITLSPWGLRRRAAQNLKAETLSFQTALFASAKHAKRTSY